MPQGPDDPSLSRGRTARLLSRVDRRFRAGPAPTAGSGRLCPVDLWLRQVLPRSGDAGGADLLYSRIPAMPRHGRRLHLAVRHRALSAMARRSPLSGRWAFRSTARQRRLSRPHPPFGICGGEPIAGPASRRRRCSSRITASIPAGCARRWRRGAARKALGLPLDRTDRRLCRPGQPAQRARPIADGGGQIAPTSSSSSSARKGRGRSRRRRGARECPHRPLADPRDFAALPVRRRHPGHSAVARAARPLRRLRAADEDLPLPRRRPARSSPRGAPIRRSCSATPRPPGSCRPTSRMPPLRRLALSPRTRPCVRGWGRTRRFSPRASAGMRARSGCSPSSMNAWPCPGHPGSMLDPRNERDRPERRAG